MKTPICVMLTLMIGAAVLATAVAPSPAADADRGRMLFTAKSCARCHRPAGQSGVGPAVDTLKRSQGGFELAGRIWNHAPGMFTALSREAIPWPEISRAEMADLMTYLGGDPARDPRPDLFQGQATLVQKGCLRCHSLRGEGARLAPDLADRRAAYDSSVEWTTRMWQHTPRMAGKAIEMGIFYPLFSGDELVNLVGYLKSVAR